MGILGCFGVGSRAILAENCCVEGIITSVKTCRWLKVNTKPVRLNGLDGAKFPHIIYFTYRVDAAEYKGSRFVNWNRSCPEACHTIPVYFDRKNPSRYAVRV